MVLEGNGHGLHDVELVRALIKAGANVKLTNQLGTSAITEAAIIGNTPIIEALLKAGTDPNFKTPNGETPLMDAARSGKVDAAKALLDAGADINAKETWGEQSALMWAAALSQADMVKFLASKGANLNDHGADPNIQLNRRPRIATSHRIGAETRCSRRAPRRYCGPRAPVTTSSSRCCWNTRRWSIYRARKASRR